jgi:hypothetical protein
MFLLPRSPRERLFQFFVLQQTFLLFGKLKEHWPRLSMAREPLTRTRCCIAAADAGFSSTLGRQGRSAYD